MIDLNGDGKVDWFVADDAPRGPPYKIRLYEGDGKGRFRRCDVAADTGRHAAYLDVEATATST